MPRLAKRLEGVRILFRSPDAGGLWGVPYLMREGQAPYDLWKARKDFLNNLSFAAYDYRRSLDEDVQKRLALEDWVLIPEFEWDYRSEEDKRDALAFLEKWKGSIPKGPREWVVLEEIDGGRRED